jgi:hypothetical protein
MLPAEPLGGPRIRFRPGVSGPRNGNYATGAPRCASADSQIGECQAVTIEASAQVAAGRQRLPNRREHELVTFEHDGIRYSFPDGNLSEIFLNVPGKVGTAIDIVVRDGGDRCQHRGRLGSLSGVLLMGRLLAAI